MKPGFPVNRNRSIRIQCPVPVLPGSVFPFSWVQFRLYFVGNLKLFCARISDYKKIGKFKKKCLNFSTDGTQLIIILLSPFYGLVFKRIEQYIPCKFDIKIFLSSNVFKTLFNNNFKHKKIINFYRSFLIQIHPGNLERLSI